MRHTNGPWKVAYRNGTLHVTACDERGTYIAAVRNEMQPYAESNAHLIAAAPDLLDALRLCANVLAGHDMSKSALTKALEKSRDALTKATPLCGKEEK